MPEDLETLNGADKNVEFLSYNKETGFYSCIIDGNLVTVDELGNCYSDDGNIYPIGVDVKGLRDEAQRMREREAAKKAAAAKAKVNNVLSGANIDKSLKATLNKGSNNSGNGGSGGRRYGSGGGRSWIQDHEERQDEIADRQDAQHRGLVGD